MCSIWQSWQPVDLWAILAGAFLAPVWFPMIIFRCPILYRCNSFVEDKLQSVSLETKMRAFYFVSSDTGNARFRVKDKKEFLP